MSDRRYRSIRPDSWAMPRPHQDESLRRKKHGRIRPMEEPGWLARLFDRERGCGCQHSRLHRLRRMRPAGRPIRTKPALTGIERR